MKPAEEMFSIVLDQANAVEAEIWEYCNAKASIEPSDPFGFALFAKWEVYIRLLHDFAGEKTAEAGLRASAPPQGPVQMQVPGIGA